jgi:hypothetical protein
MGEFIHPMTIMVFLPIKFQVCTPLTPWPSGEENNRENLGMAAGLSSGVHLTIATKGV